MTWRDYLYQLCPPWLQNHWGERYIGVNALVGDIVSEGAGEARKVSWLRQSTSPNDVLPYIGEERSIERYPEESSASYRARLIDAWNVWQYAGHESSIIGQLEVAGYPNVEIFNPVTWDRGPQADWEPPDDHWSRFWVFFPISSDHGVTGPGPEYGDFDYGDGSMYGITGVDIATVGLWRHVVQKWKPVDWIAVSLIFEIDGATYGTGHVYGEEDLVYGGSQAVIAAL